MAKKSDNSAPTETETENQGAAPTTGETIDGETGEVTGLPATAEAVETNAMVMTVGNVGVIGGMRFKVKEVVNRPVLAIDNLLNVWTFVKVEKAMYEGKEVKVTRKEADGGGNFTSKATLLDVIELASGRPAVIVCGSVLKSTFEEKYPGGAYVGKYLGIQFRRVPGKNYKQVDMVELEQEA